MNILHFMYCPFTGLGLHGGYRGDKWLKNRIRVFNQFVLQSLVNQSKREFVLWISWRPADRKNKIVQDFKKNLDEIRGLTTVFTYGGVMFWDDKYDNDQLLERLRATLPELKSYAKDADVVYMTIQPSDDMYLYNAVEGIQNYPYAPHTAIGWRDGYIINYATKEIAEYNPDTHPPFYTIMFPKDTFLNPDKHYEYIGPYKSHEYVPDFLDYKTLPGRGFVVGTHGENISTTFIHPYKGKTLSDKEKDDILIKTGTLFSDTVIVRRGGRLIARQVLNLMPFQDIIRNYYHSLPSWLKRI